MAVPIYTRVAKYWLKLLGSGRQTAIYQCYQAQLMLANKGVKCWVSMVKDILYRYGYQNEWEAQNTGVSDSVFIAEFRKRIIQVERMSWVSNVNLFSSLSFYKTIKFELCFEQFLKIGLTRKEVNMIVRLRGGLLAINCNQGRWRKASKICPICNSGKEETEHHVFFDCVAWNFQRTVSGIRYMDFFKNRSFLRVFSEPSTPVFKAIVRYMKLVLEERENIINVLG